MKNRIEFKETFILCQLLTIWNFEEQFYFQICAILLLDEGLFQAFRWDLFSANRVLILPEHFFLVFSLGRVFSVHYRHETFQSSKTGQSFLAISGSNFETIFRYIRQFAETLTIFREFWGFLDVQIFFQNVQRKSLVYVWWRKFSCHKLHCLENC